MNLNDMGLSQDEILKKWLMIKKMSGISEFIDTLDCLYELGKIEFDEEEEVLRYAV